MASQPIYDDVFVNYDRNAAPNHSSSASSTVPSPDESHLPIEDYGIVGNMRTCALIGKNGSLDYMCWPNFDSPSVFCKLLDLKKGGYFSIRPIKGFQPIAKQQYLMKTNILQTRWIHEVGVATLTDFFARSQPYLIRRVKCIRGKVTMRLEFFPAFNYATVKPSSCTCKEFDGGTSISFSSPDLTMRLDAVVDCDDLKAPASVTDHLEPLPQLNLNPDGKCSTENAECQGIDITFTLTEGQGYSFILREVKANEPQRFDNLCSVIAFQKETHEFWTNWIARCKYKGRFQDMVERSLMILKLLTFEPTGAIVASPTFSLPEDIGSHRNWDYRYSWVRDASFTLYVLLRVGFRSEAEAYINFILDRLRFSRNPDGSLPIMFTIHGETNLAERELTHLSGYKNSAPVRIGNGAAYHTQLDIYGELMDAIYLYHKYGKPVSYDQWVTVRDLTDYIMTIWQNADMSIWEVRGQKENFVYSKVMLWVAFDRALRLAFKRSFPCPNREKWQNTRDQIYEDIMHKGFNKEMNCFVQSYESNEVLDSAVLIMPLVFFIAPTDPRFLGTLNQILKVPEKGGLTSTGLVYRYNHLKSQDGKNTHSSSSSASASPPVTISAPQNRPNVPTPTGVGGREGSFTMCTLWLIEALTRAGRYEPRYLSMAINIFENLLSFGNHLGILSEEIAASGEQLGNTPQAFSHIALISAAFNLDRTLGKGNVEMM